MNNGCGACHTLTAAGANGKIGPDLDKIKGFAKAANQPLDAFIHESIVKPDAYVEKGFPKGVMPHTFASLPKATLDALVAFISDSAKG
jgi:cytochrome c oxidase subunit 2